MIEPSYIITEVQLSYKNPVHPDHQFVISRSQDAYDLLLKSWDDNRIDFVEDSKLILLNRANKVLGLMNLSSGGINSTVVDPKLVFAAALKANASSIILAHNHPSGSLLPSQSDKSLTNQIYQVGQFLSLTLLDHIIVSRHGYYSFGDDCTLSS